MAFIVSPHPIDWHENNWCCDVWCIIASEITCVCLCDSVAMPIDILNNIHKHIKCGRFNRGKHECVQKWLNSNEKINKNCGKQSTESERIKRNTFQGGNNNKNPYDNFLSSYRIVDLRIIRIIWCVSYGRFTLLSLSLTNRTMYSNWNPNALYSSLKPNGLKILQHKC